jgi:hypothetical protein
VLDVGRGHPASIPQSFAHGLRALQKAHPCVVHYVLSYSVEPRTREATRKTLQTFQDQVGGRPVFAGTIFADQRQGRGYETKDRREASGWRTVGPGKDYICQQRPFHAIVDDNANICRACRSRGIPTFPVRKGQERHNWTSKSYEDVLAAAEAITFFIDELKVAREERLSRLAGPSRATVSARARLSDLPNVEVPDSSDEDAPHQQR